MLSTFSVLYLFLGGTGAGVIALCSVFDLFLVRQPFGGARYMPGVSVHSIYRFLDIGMFIGWFATILGVFCLIFDLGRMDRLLSLFLHPSFSLLTLGAFMLAFLMVASGFLVVLRFMYFPHVSRQVVSVVEGVTIVFAIGVMLYTGVLLQTLGVAVWRTPIIPLMFLLSSLSGGSAVLLLVALWVGVEDRLVLLMRTLIRVDIALIVAELVVVVLFVLWGQASDHPAVQESFTLLIHGEYALVWWLGFFCCGLVIPLAVELVEHFSKRVSKGFLIFVAFLVLVGVLSLRYSLAESGVHRSPELEAPPLLVGEENAENIDNQVIVESMYSNNFEGFVYNIVNTIEH